MSTSSPADAGYRKCQYPRRLEPAKSFLHRPQIKIHPLKHLKRHGAFLIREGSKHSIFQKEQFRSQIPRHNEIVDELVRKICKDLGIPFVR